MIKIACQSILRAMSDFFPRDRGDEGACSNSDTGTRNMVLISHYFMTLWRLDGQQFTNQISLIFIRFYNVCTLTISFYNAIESKY